MNIDLPHLMVTVLVIMVVTFAVEHSGLVKEASRGKRALTIGAAVGLAVFVLNLVWPSTPI